MIDEQLAQLFHEQYEFLAPSFGYSTREESRKPWADVPPANKALMIAVCGKVREALQVAAIAPQDALLTAVDDHCADLDRCADALREYPEFSNSAAEIRKAAAELRAARSTIATQIEWTDEHGCKHSVTAPYAANLLKQFFDAFPDGLDEIESSIKQWRERAEAAEAKLAAAPVQEPVTDEWPQIGMKVRHKRTSGIYRIEDFGLCKINELWQSVVIYRRPGDSAVFVREAGPFCANFECVEDAAPVSTAAPVAAQPQEPIGYIVPTFIDRRRSEYEQNGTVMYAKRFGMATMPVYAAPVAAQQEKDATRLSELQTELAAERNHRNQVQRALMFWLPMVPKEPEEISNRVADDAMLLMGYEGEEELSAEALGWISIGSKDAQHAAWYRQLRDLPIEMTGKPGIPCIAVPSSAKTGEFVTGDDADAALSAQANQGEKVE